MPEPDDPPTFFILAGPNGAGKTTAAPFLLHDLLRIEHFINADTIASGLSAFAPETMAFAAGRLMLQRMRELSDQRRSFAIETTLASRTFAPWVHRLRASGYRCELIFLALPDAGMAQRRVAQRVRLGGHDIPRDVVHRRFHAGIRNFFDLYQPLVDDWRLYDNEIPQAISLVASGSRQWPTRIIDSECWDAFKAHAEVK